MSEDTKTDAPKLTITPAPDMTDHQMRAELEACKAALEETERLRVWTRDRHGEARREADRAIGARDELRRILDELMPIKRQPPGKVMFSTSSGRPRLAGLADRKRDQPSPEAEWLAHFRAHAAVSDEVAALKRERDELIGLSKGYRNERDESRADALRCAQDAARLEGELIEARAQAVRLEGEVEQMRRQCAEYGEAQEESLRMRQAAEAELDELRDTAARHDAEHGEIIERMAKDKEELGKRISAVEAGRDEWKRRYDQLYINQNR